LKVVNSGIVAACTGVMYRNPSELSTSWLTSDSGGSQADQRGAVTAAIEAKSGISVGDDQLSEATDCDSKVIPQLAGGPRQETWDI
jgi:hypothetical protein